ncbi:DUF1638 domain-containing protein [Puniceibacterium sp. IMCC21224]|uniref:DUF1638 domain-containing protein n=1 Tax=Puniceibacterium sp. IMCC21224 TaxID=1618204 RepID=UPI00065D96E9|nr:DUF1638 domain-containing protein [Puniceibacterium sp. IMCC21224]KMK67129.1 Protein of unknown function (DUF1638) [Puniceibacterium sp. IMCC21224]
MTAILENTATREGFGTSESAKPTDGELTDVGLAPQRTGRILLVACGALAREIIDVRDRNGWDHMDLTCLPAILHNHPDKITDAVRAAVARHRDAYESVHVVYADCGTGGLLQAACAELGVELVAGPHCYSFFEGNSTFADRDEITAFYLTDFLVRQFDAFVWKPLGLDRHPDLRDMYFGNYQTLVYQAQTNDPALTERARSYAERLGLAFERRYTGYGDLETTLDGWARR